MVFDINEFSALAKNVFEHYYITSDPVDGHISLRSMQEDTIKSDLGLCLDYILKNPFDLKVTFYGGYPKPSEYTHHSSFYDFFHYRITSPIFEGNEFSGRENNSNRHVAYFALKLLMEYSKNGCIDNFDPSYISIVNYSIQLYLDSEDFTLPGESIFNSAFKWDGNRFGYTPGSNGQRIYHLFKEFATSLPSGFNFSEFVNMTDHHYLFEEHD